MQAIQIDVSDLIVETKKQAGGSKRYIGKSVSFTRNGTCQFLKQLEWLLFLLGNRSTALFEFL